jgi:hypothetical protein
MGEEKVTFELNEPAAPETLLPRDYTQVAWVSAALLALILLAAWLIRRKLCHPSGSPRIVRNLAYKEASRAMDQIAAPHARAAAVQTSLILRKYLSLAADDPALFETHEEFIARNDALNSLTESARAACARGFARLASFKYAPEVPAVEAPTVVSEARELLETLHRGFQG